MGSSKNADDSSSSSLPLAPYVPRCVLSRLAQGLFEEEEEENMSGPVDVDDLEDKETSTALSWPIRPHYKAMGGQGGTVFFLDLSGYTKFASTRTADAVARRVNELFTQMIAVVHSFAHCEVLKFCGDALLCLCHVPNESELMATDHTASPLMNASQRSEPVDIDEYEESQEFLRASSNDEEDDDNETQALALSLEIAIACSWQVNEQVFGGKDKIFSTSSSNLCLHTGIACGKLVELFVGGISGRFEHLISGAPLEAIGHALETAKAGDVVVDTSGIGSALIGRLQTKDRLKGTLEAGGGGFLVKSVSDSRLELFRSGVGGSLASVVIDIERTDPESLEPLREALLAFTPLGCSTTSPAEFRQCTILFLELPGFASEDGASHHGAFEDTQKIVRQLQTVLEEYGGNMRQLLQDDKGTVAIAVFGLPTRSHEDDAARAVKTAMAVVAKTACCAVGVATGDVLVGRVGSDERCEYSAVGDAANMAARLMGSCSKLHKKILVCPSTKEAAARTSSGSLGFSENHTLLIKGKGIQEVYVPTVAEAGTSSFMNKSTYRRDSGVSIVSMSSQDDSEGGMIQQSASSGELEVVRQKELKEIFKSMPGGAVCLTAEAGAGKSTLAASFAEQAVDNKLATGVVYAAAVSTEIDTPFCAFKSIVGDFCRRVGGPEAAFRRCGLDPELAPLINPLLDEPLEPNDQVAQLSPKEQRMHAVSFVHDIVRNVTQRSESGEKVHKLLVVEDLHWADECSALVVQDLAMSECSLLATARHLPPILQDVTKEIPLEPLSLDEAFAVADPYMGKVSVEDMATLFKRSGGNTLFFKEMLHCAAAGVVEVNENLPPTVRGVLVSRIDTLSPQCIELLKAGSVFGCTFSPSDAAKLVGMREGSSEKLTSCAIQSELLETVPSNNPQEEEQVRFSHALARDAAYSLIPASQVASMHDKAASMVQSQELFEYHLVVAAQMHPSNRRGKLAVQALNDGTRERLAMGAISLDRARIRWSKARALLRKYGDEETRRRTELEVTLEEARILNAWSGVGSPESGQVFAKALSLTKRGDGTEEEIMALAGLWMNATSNMDSNEMGQNALDYAEELRDLAIDPSSIPSPGEMDWAAKEIYNVVWMEYSRRGRLRDMKRYLDPVLEALTPHGGKSVLGYSVETSATIFGAKVAWLTGQFDEALPIASSGIGITDEAFSVAHSRVWGLAQILAWNGHLDAMDATLEDKALTHMSPFHSAVHKVLQIYRGIMKEDMPLGSVYARFMGTASLIPCGEFPFTVCYALIQRGYEMKLDVPDMPHSKELCEALSSVLKQWKELRDNSDGWGPGLFHWASGALELFEDPSSDSSNDTASSLFSTGSTLAEEEGALGALLLIQASRVKMMLHQNARFTPALQDANNELARIRHLCTGDPAIVNALAFADHVDRQVTEWLRPANMMAGAVSVGFAAAGSFFKKRQTWGSTMMASNLKGSG